jgi:ATP-dependent protease ClpP protease subunit
MKNNDDGAFPFSFLPDTKSIRSFRQTIAVNIHHFYVTDEIGDVEPYLEMINTLKTAESHDTIYIYLNTPGGDLNTAVQIISAMNQCPGMVITSIEGSVCSAGTMIFLSGHKFMVNNNCAFMIHCYSQWSGGKGPEIASQVKFQEQYFKKLSEDIYGGFLTAPEISDMLDGKDFWFDSEQVIARLKLDAKASEEAEQTFTKAAKVIAKKKAKKN